MALLLSSTFAPSSNPKSTPPMPSELDLLLPRLQRSVHELEKSKSKDEFEIHKLGANVYYARALLVGQQKETLGFPLGTRRTEAQARLNSTRELLEALEERQRLLLDSIPSDSEDDDDEDPRDADGEDILATLNIVKPGQRIDSSKETSALQQITPEYSQSLGSETTPPPLPAPEEPVTYPPAQIQNTVTSSSLRARPVSQSHQQRHELFGSADATHTATTAATSSRFNALQPPALPATSDSPHDLATTHRSKQLPFSPPGFPSIPRTPPPEDTPTELAIREKITQDAIADQLLEMARKLKESTRNIGISLEEDRDVVERAGAGMEKTKGEMDGAQQRMLALKKTRSGAGIWGLLSGKVLGGWMWEWKMYAIIVLLWLALLLLVFVAPKLRF